jgi:multicomponent Na+:H+ antiporter subunit C
MQLIQTHGIYIVSVIIMVVGLYGVIANRNFIQKLICLGVFQVSILLLYISVGYIEGARIPIHSELQTATLIVNPLPHVLMLTAIVVGVATLAVGLALALRIRENYGTLDERDVFEKED